MLTSNDNNHNTNLTKISDSYNIRTGKIEGSGVIVGSNNFIAGPVIVNTVIPESRDLGLTLLKPTHFYRT